MNGVSLLLLLSSLGATTTVERGANGQSVYTIRIESVLVNEMRSGQQIPIVVAAKDRRIRHFKIAVIPDGTSRTTPSRNFSDFNSRSGDLFDYEPVQYDNGEIEYIVQISPERLQSLAAGSPIEGDIAADIPEVHRFLIFVGIGQLPSQQQNAASTKPGYVPQPTGNEGNLVQAGAEVRNDTRGNTPLPSRTQYQPASQPATSRSTDALAQFNRTTDQRAWRNNPDSSTISPPPFTTNPQSSSVNSGVTRPGSLGTNDRNTFIQPPATNNQYQPTYDPNGVYVSQNQPQFPLPNQNYPQNYATNPAPQYQQQPIPTVAARTDPQPQQPPPVNQGTWSQPPVNVQAPAPTIGIQAPAAQVAAAQPAATAPAKAAEEPKSSWPLVLTSLALFASIGFNLWLGWLAWSFFWRYREAVTESARVRSTSRQAA